MLKARAASSRSARHVFSEEYRAGHIPGALSIPVDELTVRLKELSKERDVVA